MSTFSIFVCKRRNKHKKETVRKQPDMEIIAGIWQSYSRYDRVIDLENEANKDTS